MSTYANTGIELIGTGEQSGTWGDTTNTNLQIVDRLTSGVGKITLSGTTHTLSTTDGVLSDTQYAVLLFSGSPSGTNIVTIQPSDLQRVFFVKNTTSESVILSQGTGNNVTIATGKSAVVYTDGTGAAANVVDLTNSFVATDALLSTNNLSDLDNASTSRTNLGVAIGSDVQAYDAGLQSISGLTTAADKMIYTTASDTYAVTDITSFGRSLLDDADASAVLTTLGITSTVAELNILDGVTADTAELNILDGVTATTTELNYNDITTLGTSEASKTVTTDANGNIQLTEEVQAVCYLETVVALSGTTPTVDCDEANNFTLSTTGNTTFTFDYSGVNLTTNDAYGFTLKITAGGTHTLTWPSSVDWAGGSAPTAPESGQTDVYVFYTVDGGTNWYGALAIDAAA